MLLEGGSIETASHFYEEMVAKQKSFLASLYTIPVAYLIGDPGLARDAAKKLREKYQPPRPGVRWYSDIADFCAGALTDEELEKIAGDSNYNKCEGHFFIGLKQLSEGDLLGAKEHFRKSIDTPFEDQLDYSFSRAFLDRLEKDSTWPAWIHKKKADKK